MWSPEKERRLPGTVSSPAGETQQQRSGHQRDDDLALMHAVAARDPNALRALYDRYAGLVFTLALRILRDRAEAEELLTDVFWELWSKAQRFDASRGTAIIYLTTLTRSRAIDRVRSRASKLKLAPLESQDIASASTSATPAADSLLAERRGLIRRAIEQLDPSQRQAIECAYYDGLSHSEIADRLNKPLGTVKTYIRQGLIRLRESLRSVYGGAAAP
jgi:RNA polymerase sigma-70 factor (ECF subfamily)